MNGIAHAICSAFIAAVPVAAQTSPGPPLNVPVRLEMRDGKRITGMVAAFDADTILLDVAARLARGDVPLAIPVATVRAYSVSGGRDRWRGARRGALVGSVLGLVLIGVALHADATTDADLIVSSTMLVVPAAVGIVVIGAGLGALAGPRRWTSPIQMGVGERGAPRGPLRVGIDAGF